jgi:hypothetical protein
MAPCCADRGLPRTEMYANACHELIGKARGIFAQSRWYRESSKARDLKREDALMLQCGVCRRVLLCHVQIIRLSYARTTIVRSCKHTRSMMDLDTDKDSFITAP